MKLRGASLVCRMLRNDCVGGDSRSIRSRILELLRSESEGSAIVETAFMMPIFVIILTGMLSTVMGLYTYQQLDLATFTAAEALGSGQGTVADPCATVATSVTNSLSGYNTANFTYTVWIAQNPPFTSTSGTAFSCTGSSTTAGNGNYFLTNAEGQPVTVQVSYVYTWFPIFTTQTTGNLKTIETVIVD